jgi:hypothetical protein
MKTRSKDSRRLEMAHPQLVVKREPSKVIQGTRQQIVAELQKIGDEENLMLIIPGRVVEKDGGPITRKSFDEVFGPLQQGFEESGMTEEETIAFVDAEWQAYRV